MRLAIVDDVHADAETLRTALTRQLRPDTFIDVYSSGAAFLAAEAHYALVFMDIIMADMDGIEAARQLRMRDMGCLIVFLTASRDYAFDAFPVHPFDYLVKPLDEAALVRVLSEARRALEREERTLSIKVGRQRMSLPLSALCYACARDHFVYVTLTDGRELKCYMTFSQIRAMLEPEARFLECNRGVIINMDEVRAFDGERFVMNDRHGFPVRLREKLRISECFYQYTFRKMRGGDG